MSEGMDLSEHWRAMPLADNDRLEAALLDVMDEDDAMTALQIVQDHCVPAASLRGAVAAGDALDLICILIEEGDHGEPVDLVSSVYREAMLGRGFELVDGTWRQNA